MNAEMNRAFGLRSCALDRIVANIGERRQPACDESNRV